jgi:hypothetical protein
MGRSVAEAQRILREVSPSIKTDGSWGRRTQAAYDAAPADVKARVRAIFTSRGYVMPWEQRWVSSSEVANMITSATGSLGIPQYAQAARDMVNREAQRKDEKGERFYNANSVSPGGGYYGLMQMGRAAWTTAQKEDPTLGDYSKKLDPYENIRAGVAYIRYHAKQLRAAGVDPSSENLYLAHNQGLGFFTRGTRTAVAKQSPEVQAMIARYDANRIA